MGSRSRPTGWRRSISAIASARVRARLAALEDRRVNYDPAQLDLDHPPAGWLVDDRRQALAREPPGDPDPRGSFEVAARLIRGYEFADPSIVRAFYDLDAPLNGRNMLLELRALGRFSVHVGVRVVAVRDGTQQVQGLPARVFGWSYRTLEGHVEQGQMDWEVRKWTDTGDVEFHVHAVSRRAPISNPLVNLGFRLLRRHERALFLDSTQRRMKELTDAVLRGETIRQTSAEFTARHLSAGDPAHETLARNTDLSR